MAEIIEIHPVNPQPRQITRVAEALRAGALIAYPTDSSYALGTGLGNKEGIERIIRIRQLGKKHNFTVMCHDFAQLGQFVIVDNAAFRTIKAVTPGPYTFILKGTKEVPRAMLQPKKHTVGARIPLNPVALDLVAEMGEPILSSTLLLPGDEEPPAEAWQIEERIGHEVDIIVDAGVAGTDPSTVVDFTSGAPEVTRVGAGDISPFA
ncbi:L-threonylcarbamoyladenylate synthase [Brevibacterium sp. 50QC2O2]|uniref:L-threonylcarbamoyladenylate synthase n=1 Tax=Brevibacterium TaxID=1696 RepID=UPI00211BB21C|nr:MULTISPECIES: L-threonylcarbamoyladenylate synthase [unclassified Brevibacterium]MCQ9384224.1 L-threonylcarbamoyladenylate synthase [Brevibacterium sp. 68QC2CO]MCQ9388297.1 L-threonylcarbamoyladenylate synthase [Brevibacterium sp. 50QC2O2]